MARNVDLLPSKEQAANMDKSELIEKTFKFFDETRYKSLDNYKITATRMDEDKNEPGTFQLKPAILSTQVKDIIQDFHATRGKEKGIVIKVVRKCRYNCNCCDMDEPLLTDMSDSESEEPDIISAPFSKKNNSQELQQLLDTYSHQQN